MPSSLQSVVYTFLISLSGLSHALDCQLVLSELGHRSEIFRRSVIVCTLVINIRNASNKREVVLLENLLVINIKVVSQKHEGLHILLNTTITVTYGNCYIK